MRATFVHVSDIHFGQERDHSIHIHDDVKQQLIEDAAEVIANLGGSAQGILVTGDVAFSGKREQYSAASVWLDQLASRIGCPIERVQMVPGNHDLDRQKLSGGASRNLDYIRTGGANEYEEVVGNPLDRATLLARFDEFNRFSFAYQCGLDEEAKFASNLRIEIGPNRWIRFVRLNSALLCTGDEREEEPELMIGSRQFTIPRNAGEENIVLVHHPMHWYKDADDVRQYIRARARVFISGHEHNPKVKVDNVSAGCDVLMLAAGAAVPFKSDDVYTYTYNIVEFDWDENSDSLKVTVRPRAWNPPTTSFIADDSRLGGAVPTFVLGSPNFRRLGTPVCEPATSEAQWPSPLAGPNIEQVPIAEAGVESHDMTKNLPVQEGYDLALLRFFRDLVESERLRLLLDLDAIPVDFDDRMTQGVERLLFDSLIDDGKVDAVNAKIDQLLLERLEVPRD